MILTGCSQSTTLSGSWADPNFAGNVNKVFIVGLASQEATRRIFEDEFVRQLAPFGVTGVPSYVSHPDSAEVDENKIAAQVAEKGADAIVMAHVTGSRTEEVANPGRVTTVNSRPSPTQIHNQNRHRHYRNYWDRHREVIIEPATITQFEIVTVEANLFSAETGELIWSAQLETVLERDLQALLSNFVSTVVEDLKRNDLI